MASYKNAASCLTDEKGENETSKKQDACLGVRFVGVTLLNTYHYIIK